MLDGFRQLFFRTIKIGMCLLMRKIYIRTALHQIAFFSIAFIFVFSLVSCVASAPGGKGVDEIPGIEKIIKVGFSVRVPQLAAENNGKRGGLEIDLINYFAEKYNFIVELSQYQQGELLFALRRGEIDIAIPSATDAEIKENFLLPCAKHLRTGQRILVNKKVSLFIKDLSQVNCDDITVNTVASSPSAEYAKKILPLCRQASYADLQSCIKKTAKNTSNIILLNPVDSAVLLASGAGGDLKAVLSPQGEEYICWAVRRSDSDWKKMLDEFAEIAKKDGVIKNLIDKNDADVINR